MREGGGGVREGRERSERGRRWFYFSPCCVVLQMEEEMIDKLDVFISGGMGDANYRTMLHHM